MNIVFADLQWTVKEFPNGDWVLRQFNGATDVISLSWKEAQEIVYAINNPDYWFRDEVTQ
jgi:hypothetical protein